VTRSSRRLTSGGFTLIEVLIAVSILALISGLLVTSFSSLKRSKEGIQRSSDRYREGRLAMARITRELESAYVSKHIPIDQSMAVIRTIFKAQQDSPADRLDFNAFVNRRTDRDARQSDQGEVSYYGEESPHNAGQIDLLRRLNTRLDLEPTEGGRAEVLATDIDLFDLQFLDPLLGSWIEEWDTSTVVGQLDRLPLQIKVQLVLNGGERLGGDGDRAPITFVAKVVLPMRTPLQFAGVGR
jgi:general secretion pathway protein J